jgi:hypothetical protein
MNRLTGKTRLSSLQIDFAFRPPRKLLVLQVEYENGDFESSPCTTLWRDARTEDLTELERLNPGFIANFSKGST